MPGCDRSRCGHASASGLAAPRPRPPMPRSPRRRRNRCWRTAVPNTRSRTAGWWCRGRWNSRLGKPHRTRPARRLSSMLRRSWPRGRPSRCCGSKGMVPAPAMPRRRRRSARRGRWRWPCGCWSWGWPKSGCCRWGLATRSPWSPQTARNRVCARSATSASSSVRRRCVVARSAACRSMAAARLLAAAAEFPLAHPVHVAHGVFAAVAVADGAGFGAAGAGCYLDVGLGRAGVMARTTGGAPGPRR